MAGSSNRRGWLWLLIAGIAFLGIVASFGGAFIYAAKAVGENYTELELNGSTCRDRDDWSSAGMIFLRKGSGLDSADTLASITLRDPDGNTVPLSLSTNTSLDIPKGQFESLAAIDLSMYAPHAEICIDASGLDGTLSPGDLIVVGNFMGPLLTAALSSCALNAVLAVITVAALMRTRHHFAKA